MKRINKEIDNCLHFLFHCSLKDTEFETQREQFREVYNYIENLEDGLKQIRNYIKEHCLDNEQYCHDLKESDIKLLLIVIDKILGDNNG